MQSVNKHETVIGMVLEDIYTDFSKELIQSVLNAIPQKRDIRLMVLAGKYDHGDSAYSDHSYKTVYNTIFKLSEMCELDGLIIHLGSVNSHRGELIVERQLERYKSIPKVFIACDSPELTTVNYDNETGIREAVDALANVNGLTRLCMLGGRDDNTDAQQRKEIFARCLRENGIDFTEQNYIGSTMSVDSEKEAAELLDANPGVQAIFCVNDAVAKGLYNVMEQRGLVPGKDILVFGFDNTRMAGEMIPSLSSVGLADCTLGQKAMELLLAKMSGEEVSSALVPTRLYGRESFPHEMYDYNILEIINADASFIYRMFDDCFYRYRSETVNRELVDLRRLFCEIMSRLFNALKRRYMSIEDYEMICDMIDRFFEKGAMQYTDAVKLLKSADKLQAGISSAQRSSSADAMVSRIFLRVKDRAILALSEQNIQDSENIIGGRDKLQQFLIDGTVYAGSKKDNLENIIRSIDKLGIENSALYLFDEPAVYNSSNPYMFPDNISLRCVVKSGEMFIMPKQRQKCHISRLFTRSELPSRCKGFVVLPVFYRDIIYGVFICELTKDIYNRGEYLALQLGRTIYLNDEQTVIRLANTDTLTGLFNRRYFYNYLSGPIRKKLCLLYFDLDHFKAINDNFGHHIGDEVLMRTAQLIREAFPDALAARLGGDEFAAIDFDSNPEEIAEKCAALEEQVRQEFGRYGCGTALSIGKVYAEDGIDDVDKLMQQGDARMYEKKRENHRLTV